MCPPPTCMAPKDPNLNRVKRKMFVRKLTPRAHASYGNKNDKAFDPNKFVETIENSFEDPDKKDALLHNKILSIAVAPSIPYKMTTLPTLRAYISLNMHAGLFQIFLISVTPSAISIDNSCLLV